MIVKKEGPFLIFDFEDGKKVKYNFATKECIGKSGKVVHDLKSQLKGISIREICDCCEDTNYGNYLRYVYERESHISNIGTILEKSRIYAQKEQFFSAGIKKISPNFYKTISDVPKGLIKIHRETGLTLTNEALGTYLLEPDAYNIAFSLQYDTLTDNQVYTALTAGFWSSYHGGNTPSYFVKLMREYHYNAKSLLLYIDHLATYEAIDDMYHLCRELCDYCRMMASISAKFEKYPRNFLTTHRIAVRNYNRLRHVFEEEKFKKRINEKMEYRYKDFQFLYPKSTADIKTEAAQQSNCVASYIQKVINGECDILFLRKTKDLSESLVTIEVKNNKVVQARGRFNRMTTPEEDDVIEKYNLYLRKEFACAS